jgi:hypothetical protein
MVCVDDAGRPACVTNADCASGTCALDCPTPVWAALACAANTASSAVNFTFAIPGPVAVLFNGGFAPPAKLVPTTTIPMQTTTTTTTTNTTVTTLPPFPCPDQPSAGCFEPGQAAVRLRNAGRPENRVLAWRWRMGEPVAQADFGDPTVDTNYVLCAYDSVAASASLSSQVAIAAGERWHDKNPNGYVYVDPALSADGVKRVRMKTGVATQSGIRLAAFGVRLPLSPAAGADRYFEQDPRVTIQLVASTGQCWTSEFVAQDVVANRTRKFRANTARVQ